MRNKTSSLIVVLALSFGVALIIYAQNRDLGYTDTPMLTGLPYHVHDPARPHPHVVTPAAHSVTPLNDFSATTAPGNAGSALPFGVKLLCHVRLKM